ncbi:hypothetical protein G6F31_016038 [Rhizopus arrhizus]|nr:hypothetical protein G6F31_016038 [Rhizopus arrhizus]
MLIVPEVIWEYTASTVFTMPRMYGMPVGQVERMREAGIDIPTLARTGVEIFFTQVPPRHTGQLYRAGLRHHRGRGGRDRGELRAAPRPRPGTPPAAADARRTVPRGVRGGARGSPAPVVRSTDHHGGLPADLRAERCGRADVPPDGADRGAGLAGRDDLVGNLRAGGGGPVHGQQGVRKGKPADALGQAPVRAAAGRGVAPHSAANSSRT